MRTRILVAVLGVLTILPGDAAAQTGRIQPNADTIETIVTGGGFQPVAMYAPVFIRGQKMLMQVDTGAAATIIDSRVSRELGLAAFNKKVRIRTIGCTTKAVTVLIDEWKIGVGPIPSVKAIAIRMPGKLREVQGLPVAGLLGADALSFFETVGVDFRHSKLILDNPFVSTPNTFKVRTAISKDTSRPTLMVANVRIHGRRTRMAIDTGASVSTLDRSVARKARLKKVGRKVRVGAVSCRTSVQPVKLNGWRIGGKRAPDTIAVARRTGLPQQSRGLLSGLIGADIFSRYGKVTLDYKQLRVSLGFPRIGVAPTG